MLKTRKELNSVSPRTQNELERRRRLITRLSRRIVNRKSAEERQSGKTHSGLQDSRQTMEQVLFIILFAALWAAATYTSLEYLRFPWHQFRWQAASMMVLPGAVFGIVILIDADHGTLGSSQKQR